MKVSRSDSCTDPGPRGDVFVLGYLHGIDEFAGEHYLGLYHQNGTP